MDLLENPFYILNATTRDDRRKIMELSDERSLLFDSIVCSRAQSDLTTPRKRLSMEIAWLPGIGPKQASEFLSILVNSQPDLLRMNKVNPAARANLLAAGLSRLTGNKPDEIAEWILRLARSFEQIDPDDLRIMINEVRIVSGFPEVADLSMIETEIQERRRHYIKVIKTALNNLSANKLIEVVTTFVESATAKGKEPCPILIHNLIDTYEVEAQVFLEKEARNIEILIEKVKSAADAKQSDTTLSPMVNRLVQVVDNWGYVAKPIQLSKKDRGLDHVASSRVAWPVRNLALHLYNEYEKLDFSQRLTKMLQGVFADVAEVAERTAEDAIALGDIAEKRAQLIEHAKKRAEDWRREITYEADVGVIFKDKLRISPERVEWKGRCWNLESITRIRWGGTRHSVNGIPTGTTYRIVFGDKTGISSIETKKYDIYNNFTDRLWKTVGVRLLTEFLEALREGKQYRFGTTVINDQGIELVRKGLFFSNEQVFCRWNEIVNWNGAGVFCIGKKGDKKVAASFSYQEEDNIHILDAALNIFSKQNGKKTLLSSILSDQ